MAQSGRERFVGSDMLSLLFGSRGGALDGARDTRAGTNVPRAGAAFPLIREQSDFDPEVVDESLARATAAIRDLDAGSALVETMA